MNLQNNSVMTAPSKKRRSKLLVVGGIVTILCVGGMLLFWRFSSSTVDRQEIQELLEKRADALMQKDVSRYLSCFSLQYRSGSRTYDDLKTNALQWFDQFATIRFSFRILDIQVQDAGVIVEEDYTFSLTDIDGETINIAKRELLEIRRENDEWKITQALSVQ